MNKYPVSFIYAAWLSGQDPTGPLRRVRRESKERAWLFHFPMIPAEHHEKGSVFKCLSSVSVR